MILQALNDYYERKQDELPPEGWINKGVDFAILLNIAGEFMGLDCLQYQDGNRVYPRLMFLPNIGKQALKHANSGKDANLLWDNSAFVFGLGSKSETKLNSFIETIEMYFNNISDVGVIAVLKFLRAGRNDRSVFDPILNHPEFGDQIKTGGAIIIFRLIDDEIPVFHRSDVFKMICDSVQNDAELVKGFCLVTGEQNQDIELSHTVIKGVRNAQPSGAPLVSFNKDAFCSFGKKKSANSPVSKKASQRYVKSLNYLLNENIRQKIQIGDATTVFWSDRINHVEDDFSTWFDEPEKDNPDKQTEKIRALLKSVDTGVLPPEDYDTNLFILGLSPNSARISVRFWHVGTVAEFSGKIAQHFHDLEIAHRDFAKESHSIRAFLKAVAPLGELDRVPPNIAGDWMRSILSGSQYPESLYQLALRKSKGHRSDKVSRLTYELTIEYPCAAIIKACLNRKNRFQIQTEKEMTVSLDKENTNPGYRVGRLFAVLEKIQEEAAPGIKATIRDRYYSAASGTPASVFPILLRTKNHHLGKLEKGREVYFEKLLGEVVSDVSADGFPAQLSLPDQGRFAIGYYHQRQSFFTKSDKTESNNTEQGE